MNLKTYLSDKLFSKALIKADIRNHWPWPVAAFVFLVFNLILAIDNGGPSETYTAARIYSRFMNMFSFSYVLACVYGLFMGTKLFMYLDKVNSVSCMHGLPFSRKKLYLSHLFSGAVLVISPAVLVISPAVLMTVIMLLLGVPFARTWFLPECCLAFLGSYIIYALIAFAISAFAMTVCGNVIVSVLFSATIAVIPAALIGFFVYIGEVAVYGWYTPDIVEHILNFLYVFPNSLFPWRFLIYLIGGTAFLVAGYFVYKIRPLENCEEVVAFKKLRPMFVFAVGLVMGMISYMFFAGMIGFSTSLLTMIPLGLIGVIGAAMIAQKSVRLKGTWVYSIIFVIAVALISFCVKYDTFGYERRLPSADRIEYIETDLTGREFYYNDYWLEYDELPELKLTSPEEIETARALHAAYISEKNDPDKYIYPYRYNNIYDSSNFTITYKLKSGATIKRRYQFLSPEKQEQYKLALLNLEKTKASRWPILDNVKKEIIEVTVYDDRIPTPAVNYQGSVAEDITAALKYDLAHNSYQELYASGALNLRVEFYAPGTVKSTGKRPSTYLEKEEYTEGFNININANFKKTLEALSAAGYEINNDNEFSKIQKLVIRDYELYDKFVAEQYEKFYEAAETVSVRPVDEYYGEYELGTVESDIVVTDRDDMKVFYDMCGTGFSSALTIEQLERADNYNFYFIDGENTVVYDGTFALVSEVIPYRVQRYFAK